MTPVPDPSSPRHSALVAWLRSLHEQMMSRVASLSWWRMGLLMLLLIVVGSILAKMLDLEHDVERVATGARKPPVVVTLGGEDGVRVTKGGEVVHPPKATVPSVRATAFISARRSVTGRSGATIGKAGNPPRCRRQPCYRRSKWRQRWSTRLVDMGCSVLNFS